MMKKHSFNDAYGLTDDVLSGNKTQFRMVPKISRPSEKWEIAFPIFEDEDKYTSFEDMQLRAPLFGAYKWVNTETGEQTAWIQPKYRIGEVVAVAQSYKDAFYYKDEREISLITNTKGWNDKRFSKVNLLPHQIKITGVKMQKLHSISSKDCIKEGIQEFPFGWVYHDPKINKSGGIRSLSSPREAFASLIDKVCGKGTWNSNPYVFVFYFELIK